MGNEIQKTFTVSVNITMETPGALEDDINFGRLLNIIKASIAESCGRTIGVINSYMVGDVEVK